MARSRNIKPGFFKNGVLLELEPLARLLFAGLWCIADREGRLQDRPKQIKVEVLPGDNCDVDDLLQQLADAIDENGEPLILRYQVDGKRYIQIVNFSKHQDPHCKEKMSEIPAPVSDSTVQAPDLHGASTVQTPEQHPLIPDSLNLIPDPRNPLAGDAGARAREADPTDTALPSPPGDGDDLSPLPAGRPYVAAFLREVWEVTFPDRPLLPTTYPVSEEQLDRLEYAIAPFARLPGGTAALFTELLHRIGPAGKKTVTKLRDKLTDMQQPNHRWHGKAIGYFASTITGILADFQQEGKPYGRPGTGDQQHAGHSGTHSRPRRKGGGLDARATLVGHGCGVSEEDARAANLAAWGGRDCPAIDDSFDADGGEVHGDAPLPGPS
jgi:hypothetical protein